jgi:tetratricopeptide (TPR) repeat protein
VESQAATSKFKEAIFTRIVENYVLAFQDSPLPDPDLLLSLAEALLENNQYEKALETLLYAKKLKNKDARLCAMIADVYHFLGDEAQSLLYFRDAFFFGPQKINLDKIKSPAITALSAKIAEEGFSKEEMVLWLPIRAEIDGVFAHRRSLDIGEVKQIEKDALDLELDFEIRRKDRAEVEPILLNHYFMLLNHYLAISSDDTESASRLAHLLKKIKSVNPDVYERLKNK